MEPDPGELVYLEGETSCPYHWSTGRAAEAFLGALRDHAKVLGAVCGGCGDVAVPPLAYCEKCGSSISDYREVGPRGVVISWARVAGGYQGCPLEPPFRYVLVRMAGADTEMLHVAPDDERVRTGATVRPEFKPPGQREGSIRDIKWFVPDDAHGEE